MFTSNLSLLSTAAEHSTKIEKNIANFLCVWQRLLRALEFQQSHHEHREGQVSTVITQGGMMTANIGIAS